MLGLDEYRRTEQCPTCGRPTWMCQSVEAESLYEPAPPVRCHATTAMMRGQKVYLDGAHAPFEQALSWPVKIRTGD